MARGRQSDLSGAVRPRSARLDHELPARGLEHVRGLEADRARQRRGPPLRDAGARHKRGVVSHADRPQSRCADRGLHLGARSDCQSGDDGDLGIDGGRPAGDRLIAAVRRPRRDHARARPRNLASLSQDRGVLKHDPEKCAAAFRKDHA